MAIDVRWESEDGVELEAVLAPPQSKFESLIPEPTDPDYPCMRYIDPYGDTVFNQLQLSQLLNDLERTLPRCETPETRQHLEAMIALIGKANEVHTYIKFYGD